MERLEVYILKQLAGELHKEDGVLCFRYDSSYSGPALSIALPQSSEVYKGKKVHAWFDNLLPDRMDVRAGMAHLANTKNTVFDLLAFYGLDLPGAVQVVGDDTKARFSERVSGYEELTEHDVGLRLNAVLESEQKSTVQAWATAKEHWSLGGNQGKIALRSFGDKWYSCTGEAASNIVIKPGVAHLVSQALDECVTMRLVEKCGLPCARTYMHSFEGLSALVVERYDRITDSEGAVHRLHQEDFCQVLSVVPDKKYAEDGGPGAPIIMGVLSRAADESQQRFFDALVFNYLTMSTDAHAKNYSVVHLSNSQFVLAPLYDVASLAPYMDPGRLARKPYRLAMSIGGENRVGHLRKTSLQRFARISRLDEKWMFDRAYELVARVLEELPRVFEDPDLAQMEGVDELASRFIPRIRKLCQATEKNLSRTGTNYYIPNIAKAK